LNSLEENEYKIVPGRGLNNYTAINLRQNYLKEAGYDIDKICQSNLDYNSVKNNIESVIGSVELPVGIVGPLLFCDKGQNEFVFTVAGTLEGALIASLNRGAKVISLSNGFSARFIHQKMLRVPLFILDNDADAIIFNRWAIKNFERIKEVAQSYSNHAKLIEIAPVISENNVHLRFVYTTGDASGQNMTTTCTWHAMLWIVETFRNETGINIRDFIIEGNGSSDKKASELMINHGRGCCIEAECFLNEEIINKVLRTSSEKILKFYNPSLKISANDGMLGYNINVANAVAAIFVATGQDLGSIPESSVADFFIEKTVSGLHCRLRLYSLVIGTVGGGTAQLKQNEALKIMNCEGKGKIERFAKLIAGFALSLEISTYSAIVSGEFAKAHEKLGRNKPVDWLTKSEITEKFVRNALNGKIKGSEIISVSLCETTTLDNGILTNITQRTNKKLIGFIPIEIKSANSKTERILIKSKSLDIDTIKGLHLMAASVDPQLSDLISRYKEDLEYSGLQTKEIKLYELLDKNNFTDIPEYYGSYCNPEREIYLLFQEFFDKNQMLLSDSENHPELWSDNIIKSVISKINKIHNFLNDSSITDSLPEIKQFEPWNSKPLYVKMIEIINAENKQSDFSKMYVYIEDLEQDFHELEMPLTIIHNDFNPRNVAIRKDKRVCIYDWELAVKNIPHRDIMEFLCFALPENFEEDRFMSFVDFYYNLLLQYSPSLNYEMHIKACKYSIKEFLICRAAFYKVSEILMKLKFGDRIIKNSLRMIEILGQKPE